jgi:predicted transcriptional regulator
MYVAHVFTPAQLRAARGLLDWSQRDLAREAGLTLSQIKNIERGALDPRASMVAAIETAFRRTGIVLLEEGDTRGTGIGVRFLSP